MYSKQLFSLNQVLTYTKMNQIETNIAEHVHGADSVTENFASLVGSSFAADVGSFNSLNASSGGVINSDVITVSSLGISGLITPTRTAPNSYTRLTPNYCRLTQNVDPAAYGTSLTRDTITTVSAPSSFTTALVFAFQLSPGANNATGGRNVTLYFYSNSAGTTQIGRCSLQAYETSAMGIGAGTILVGLNGLEYTQVLPSAGADIFMKFTDDSGDRGGVSSQIAGIYD